MQVMQKDMGRYSQMTKNGISSIFMSIKDNLFVSAQE